MLNGMADGKPLLFDNETSAGIFAAGASGDVPPAATIAGAKTEMRYPEGIAVLVPTASLRSP